MVQRHEPYLQYAHCRRGGSSSADIPFATENIRQNIAAMRDWVWMCRFSREGSRGRTRYILSLDGRPTRSRQEPSSREKPLFIDKADRRFATEILQSIERGGKRDPVFSNLRSGTGPSTAALAATRSSAASSSDTYCSSKSILPGHPDLFYYGIHGCDMLLP